MKTSSLFFGIGAFLCAGLLGFGYYLQYGRGLEPCPLCIVQRGFFYGLLIVFLAGAIHGKGPAIYGALASLLALGGIATASRQVWLQHLPADKVPECGPDLAYMMKHFPLSRTLERLIGGTGECAKVDWTFLGLSIAEWSAAWFAFFTGYAIWLAVSGRRAARSA